MKDSSQIRMNVTSMEDIKKLQNNKKIKYINIDIMNPDLEVIYYLIDHGQKYSYSEQLDNNPGYIYVSHEIFKQSELFILDIINNVPLNLSELEMARYLYITIGKNLGYDINSLPDKNETFSLKNIDMINNIWGSLFLTKGTNHSLVKLYLYFCRLMNIDCDVMTSPKEHNLKNRLTFENTNIIVDITKDLPYIGAGFKTKYFTGYNDDLELDQKISYIKDDYNENKIEVALRNLDYTKKDIFSTILVKTQAIIQASNLKPSELATIYELIFEKYCPNFNVSINNLYIHNQKNQKEHFILINYDKKYYSYNYARNSFVEISKEEILQNMKEKKVGIYQNEQIPFTNQLQEKVIGW